MQIRNLLLAILILAGNFAVAAEVLQVSASSKVIAVSTEESHTWRVRDNVCVYQVGQEVACGVVIKLIRQGAIVRLTNVSSPVAKGDSAAYVPHAQRRTASTGESSSDQISSSSSSYRDKYNFDVTAGLSVGTNYFYPMLTFQLALGSHFALGLSPFYVSSSAGGSSVSAIGGLVTLDYYSRSSFRGFWGQVGGGLVMFNLNDGVGDVTSSSNPAMIATIGYRGQFELGMNVGVGAGILYITNVPSSSITVAFDGLLPLLILDIGFNF